MSGWKRAFSHAKEVEAEGAKYFEGFFKKSKTSDSADIPKDEKSSSSAATDEAATGDIARDKFRPTYTEAVEKEDVERGGFCQPAGLASFFKSQKNNKNNTPTTTVAENVQLPLIDVVSDVPQSDGFEVQNGMARQICRAWLKNNYLQLGQPCRNPKCERLHLIESKSVGSLYKDYSFKGLATAQRNSIIVQVQAAAAAAAASATTVAAPVVAFDVLVASTSSTAPDVVKSKSRSAIPVTSDAVEAVPAAVDSDQKEEGKRATKKSKKDKIKDGSNDEEEDEKRAAKKAKKDKIKDSSSSSSSSSSKSDDNSTVAAPEAAEDSTENVTEEIKEEKKEKKAKKEKKEKELRATTEILVENEEEVTKKEKKIKKEKKEKAVAAATETLNDKTESYEEEEESISISATATTKHSKENVAEEIKKDKKAKKNKIVKKDKVEEIVVPAASEPQVETDEIVTKKEEKEKKKKKEKVIPVAIEIVNDKTEPLEEIEATHTAPITVAKETLITRADESLDDITSPPAEEDTGDKPWVYRLKERIKIMRKPWMPIHKKITY